MRGFVLASLLLTAVLAGCSSGNGGDEPPADEGLADLGLEATSTTGVIRGVVVDNAIRPIAGVSLSVSIPDATSKATESNAEGAFGFQGLQPGTYFVKASKVGFFDTQQSVEVVASVTEPPAMKILLQIDIEATPYFQAYVFDGFVECTTSFLVLCGLPNLLSGQNITNDRFTNDFFFGDDADMIQVEMVWETNQALSPEMYFEMETLNTGCDGGDSSFLNNTSGVSPIYATVNKTQIDDWEIGTKCSIYFSTFSGPITGTPCLDALDENGLDPTGDVPGWCVGFTLEQRFTLFLHEFHSFLPPVGWRFTLDGDPIVPV